MTRLLYALVMIAGSLLFASMALASDLKVANARVTVVEVWDDPAAYFVIQNGSSEIRTIVGATSPRSESVEIHLTAFTDGVMDHQVLEKMEIPAGGAVAFATRGLYLSLVEAEPLKAGEKVTIELEFANGEKLAFEATATAE